MSNLYLCVDLFFILSGFVLEPAFPKRRNIRDSLSFITRRYIRLAPMLYSTLIFSMLYQFAILLKNSFGGGADGPNLGLTLKSIVLSVLFLQIFSSQAILLNYPMWSLSTEWIVNLLLVLPLSSNSRKNNTALLYCFGVTIQISSIFYNYPEFIVQLSRCLSGILLGVFLRTIFELKTFPYSKKLLLVLVIISAVGFFLMSHSTQKLAPLFCSIPFSTLIFTLAKIESSKSIKISESLAYWAATLSFGIYAWHVPLAGIVERYSPTEFQTNVGSRLMVLTTISCLMGFLVSKYFERPIQRYIQRIAKDKLG